MRRLITFAIFTFFSFQIIPAAFACDSCGCTLAKTSGDIHSQDKTWFFDATVEQQRWKTQPAEDANAQVLDGHDVHDKTHEEFYHFLLGAHPADRLTILTEMPTVVREAIEVEDPDNLGATQHSDGRGDLNLIAIYKVLVQDEDFLGVAGGVKFPTGETNNRNFQGELFEIEMQPGSGSYDYPLGIVYRHTIDTIVVSGNVSYVIKMKGSRGFQYGGLFFASMNAEYILNPQSKVFRTKVGCDFTVQHSQKDTNVGVKSNDSGETALFIGPGASIQANDNFSVFGNIQFPVYQTTGGVHQKLDYLWTAGAKIVW
jgi:hypothetical protein